MLSKGFFPRVIEKLGLCNKGLIKGHFFFSLNSLPEDNMLVRLFHAESICRQQIWNGFGDGIIFYLFEMWKQFHSKRKKSWASIHQPFCIEQLSVVFFYKICKFDCNTTSDWLNHMLLNTEKSGKYDLIVVKNGWWIPTQVTKMFLIFKSLLHWVVKTSNCLMKGMSRQYRLR